MICLKKNWKNQIFKLFLSKSMLTTCLRTRVSQICAKKILELSQPVLWKGFEIKSHQRRARYLKRRRNGDRYVLGGARGAPPTLAGVKELSRNICFLCINNIWSQSWRIGVVINPYFIHPQYPISVIHFHLYALLQLTHKLAWVLE